jgi:hypothetical protein
LVILLILLLVLSIFPPRNFLEQRRKEGRSGHGRNERTWKETTNEMNERDEKEGAKKRERTTVRVRRNDRVLRREGTSLEREEEANVERGRDDYVRWKERLIETEVAY